MTFCPLLPLFSRKGSPAEPQPQLLSRIERETPPRFHLFKLGACFPIDPELWNGEERRDGAHRSPRFEILHFEKVPLDGTMGLWMRDAEELSDMVLVLRFESFG
jgi:hypothetical protein